MSIKKTIVFCLAALLALCVAIAPALSLALSPGDQVVLRAANRLGVPLHETSEPSFIGRAPTGTVAEVLEISAGTGWVKIRLPGGEERWIVERYIEDSGSSEPNDEPSPVVVDDNDEPSLIVIDDNSSTESLFPDLGGEALRTQLAEAFKVDNSLGYRSARDYMFSEVDNDNGIVRGIYSGFEQPVNPNSSSPRREAFQNERGLNTEHSWPQSKGATGVAKSDLHHLFPAQVQVNSRRGSLPFDEIDDAQTTWWLINSDQLRTIPTVNVDGYSEATREAFEPREQVKGDIARAMFYFYTIYRGQADDGFFRAQQNVLCVWNELDPIDAQEQRRSQAIAVEQGNENPFVLDASLPGRLYCSNDS